MEKMGLIKIISDTHFNHKNILKYNRNYFKSVDEMNEIIIQKWNEKISKNDKVIHLGDFALGDDYEKIENIIKRLNGNITLILGNHDTASKIKDIYVKYFKILGSLCVGNYYFTHEPVHFNVINPDQVRSTGRQATINVHGHLHKGEFCSEKHINCCLDIVGFSNIVKEIEV
jgi:calcineurin-like phosphoesterase family protein